MEKAIGQTKTTAVIIGTGIVLFMAVFALLAVFEVVSWEVFGDWSLKALIVGVVLLAVGFLISAMAGAASKEK